MNHSNLKYQVEQSITNGLGYSPIRKLEGEDLYLHLFMMDVTVSSRKFHNNPIYCKSLNSPPGIEPGFNRFFNRRVMSPTNSLTTPINSVLPFCFPGQTEPRLAKSGNCYVLNLPNDDARDNEKTFDYLKFYDSVSEIVRKGAKTRRETSCQPQI